MLFPTSQRTPSSGKLNKAGVRWLCGIDPSSAGPKNSTSSTGFLIRWCVLWRCVAQAAMHLAELQARVEAEDGHKADLQVCSAFNCDIVDVQKLMYAYVLGHMLQHGASGVDYRMCYRWRNTHMVLCTMCYPTGLGRADKAHNTSVSLSHAQYRHMNACCKQRSRHQ